MAVCITTNAQDDLEQIRQRCSNQRKFATELRAIEQHLLELSKTFPNVPSRIPVGQPILGPDGDCALAILAGALEVQFRVVYQNVSRAGAVIEILGFDYNDPSEPAG